jgi:hypothetical protein
MILTIECNEVEAYQIASHCASLGLSDSMKVDDIIIEIENRKIKKFINEKAVARELPQAKPEKIKEIINKHI